MASRLVPQPECKCGCGSAVAWNPRKGKWRAYMPGHYRSTALYKNADWLREQYHGQRRSVTEIAADFGVNRSAVWKFMRRFGIEARDASESHIGVSVGERNPAWKGGVADWEYAPEWKRIARGIRCRDSWTCQLCGEQRQRWGKLLHVHHIDGDKLNNDPLNLISVCFACHPRGPRERELAPLLSEKAAVLQGGDAL